MCLTQAYAPTSSAVTSARGTVTVDILEDPCKASKTRPRNHYRTHETLLLPSAECATGPPWMSIAHGAARPKCRSSTADSVTSEHSKGQRIRGQALSASRPTPRDSKAGQPRMSLIHPLGEPDAMHSGQSRGMVNLGTVLGVVLANCPQILDPQGCRGTLVCRESSAEAVVEGRHAAEDTQQSQRHEVMKRWMASLAWS